MKWLLIGIGAITAVGGILTFWLPSPIGLPSMMLGVPLLLRYSPHARAWILQLARVSPPIHRQLSKIAAGPAQTLTAAWGAITSDRSACQAATVPPRSRVSSAVRTCA